MKLQAKDIISFIKTNPGVIYSLLLVLIIPGILYVGIYLSISQFEVRFDHITQTKALLMENVFASFIKDSSWEKEKLQETVDEILRDNTSVSKIQVVTKQNGQDNFVVVASSRKDEIGQDSQDDKQALLLSNPDVAFANLEVENGQRYWEVAKLIRGTGNNSAQMIIKTRLSLMDVDNAFWASTKRAYIVLIATAIIMLLLINHYLRLTRYIFMFNQIKEVDEMKDEFISMASHELKTPLTAINGYVDMLLTDKANDLDEESRTYLGNIRTSSNKLKELITDILDVSRIDQNRLPIKNERIDARQLSQKVISDLSQQAKEKGLNLLVDEASRPAYITVDRNRLEQVLINLVGNAIKYTLEGEVRIVVETEGETVNIAIKDTGIGMTAQQQKNLFEKFYRIKTKETAGISGTGLGLWITKQLIEKMNGEISVESIEEVGSKFIVSFPAAE